MTAFETSVPVRLTPTSRVLDREADLPPHGTTIHFGAHGGVAEHYGMTPAEPLPSTIDYLVASVGGCLIGTFAGSLLRARLPLDRAGLTGVATGTVSSSDEDNVLVLRRIDLRYTLAMAQEHRAAAEEVHAAHASRCPNARSVAGGIEVVTHLEMVEPVAA
ncbi:MAG: OsmC family protein [Thermoleophilia bacterium]